MSARGPRRSVDDAVHQTSPYVLARHFGVEWPEQDGGNLRVPCVFNASCADSTYGALSIDLDDPANRIQCFSCGTRGNLLVLLWGLWKGEAPTLPLRGKQFTAARDKLYEVIDWKDAGAESPVAVPAPAAKPAPEPTDAPAANVPLSQSDNAAARALANLYEEFVTDPDHMPPQAASWWRRRRHYLHPEICERFSMGYLPRNARSMWKGMIVYAHTNQAGEILTYSARDPDFDQKLEAWENSGRDPRKRPAKHRYVKGFNKAFELYGQNVRARLQQRDKLREFLTTAGIIVVEGMNDVMRLDELDAFAVGLTMNRASEHQIEKLIDGARRNAARRIWLMLDNDESGDDGARQLYWTLSQIADIDTRLLWSRAMWDGEFDGLEPENVTAAQWSDLLLPRMLNAGGTA